MDDTVTTEEESALELFATLTPDQSMPLVFGSPRRYVQGAGVIEQTGTYLKKLGFNACGVLLSARSQNAEGARMLKSLDEAGIRYEIATFGGESSFAEIEKHAQAMRNCGFSPDTFIALGGGKVVDAGKSIAHRLNVPAVVIPSLASNDAPCSAASVIYTPEGVTEDFELFNQNPALVLVDTAVVAAAPARYLVAGMGDAMATWYEARACALNPQGFTSFGARPTLAGAAIAELCARTVYESGEAALKALDAGVIDLALERVIEANTLLSGVGFESGGLAASHAYAQAYTVVPGIHARFLHGEMVAMGVLAQLALEDEAEEADKATRFFARIGLPITLSQLELQEDDDESLSAIVEAVAGFPFISNMNADISVAALRQAIFDADARGRSVAEALGDGPYRKLHS